ncbi:uncharacterized protein METZ01_LOCUS396831, partial [marine metagenome]
MKFEFVEKNKFFILKTFCLGKNLFSRQSVVVVFFFALLCMLI